MPLAGLCFDALGSLLDLQALRPAVAARADEATFAGFQRGFVPAMWHATAANRSVPVADLAVLVLRAAARERGHALPEAAAREVVDEMRRLPLTPGAAGALRALRGVPLAVLTNGSEAVTREALRHAGVEDAFAHVLSAEVTGRFKPAPEVYALAGEAFGAPLAHLALVAAHDWDCAGAALAGMRSVLVSRGAPVTPFLGQEPDVVIEGYEELPGVVPRLAR